MKKKVIIIGSGIAGLAVSIRLKSKGYSVEVYEKNKNVGGKLSDFYIDKFRHDFGPKLFTMPNLIEDIFENAGVKTDKYFKIGGHNILRRIIHGGMFLPSKPVIYYSENDRFKEGVYAVETFGSIGSGNIDTIYEENSLYMLKKMNPVSDVYFNEKTILKVINMGLMQTKTDHGKSCPPNCFCPATVNQPLSTKLL